MPRPTAAQISYGSVTVIFSTLAMLLMSRTSSGIGVAVIGTAAMALGLLVALTVPLPGRAKDTNAAAARAITGTTHQVADEAGTAGGPDTPAAAERAAAHAAEHAAGRVAERIGERIAERGAHALHR